MPGFANQCVEFMIWPYELSLGALATMFSVSVEESNTVEG